MASGSPIILDFSDVMTLDHVLSDKYNCYSYSRCALLPSRGVHQSIGA